jgi:hypothetical protein
MKTCPCNGLVFRRMGRRRKGRRKRRIKGRRKGRRKGRKRTRRRTRRTRRAGRDYQPGRNSQRNRRLGKISMTKIMTKMLGQGCHGLGGRWQVPPPLALHTPCTMTTN